MRRLVLLALAACPSPNHSSSPDAGSGDTGVTTSADFYVATDGNDAWSGTLAAPNADGSDGPFATIAATQVAVRPLVASRSTPITVAIRGGTYSLTAPLAFTAADSGTAAAPIVYEAYTGETPIVSGGIAITGWQQASAGVWTAQLPASASVDELTVAGLRRYRLRTTETSYLHNAGQFTFTDTHTPPVNPPCTPYAPVTGQANTYACFDRFYFTLGDLDPNWAGLTDPAHPIEILGLENWTISRMRLDHIDTTSGVSGAGVAYLTGSTESGVFFGYKPGHRYLVENVAELLADPAAHGGRFYFDPASHVVTLLANPGEDPTQETAIAPQLAQLVVGSGVEHVTFRGLTFADTAWDAPATGFAAMNLLAVGTPAALSFTDPTDIVLDGITVEHVAGFGVEFVGASAAFTPTADQPWAAQVVHSTLADLGAGGIRVGSQPANGDSDANVAQYVYLFDDAIVGGARLVMGSALAIGNAHHVTLDHAEISDFYNMGVSLGESLNWIASSTHDDAITNSHIHDLGQGVTSDMGAVHTAVGVSTGNQIVGNLFHDIVQNSDTVGYGGDGIYLDQGTTGFTVTNNVVYDVTAAAFHYNESEHVTHAPPAVPNEVANNVFALAPQMVHYGAVGNDGGHDIDFAHNVFYWDHLVPTPGENAPSPMFGYLTCNDPTAPLPCPSYFSFSGDLWFDSSDPNAARWRFLTGYSSDKTTTYQLWDAAGWQALGEDPTGAIIGDPLFGNVAQHDFTVGAGSPALALGFQPIDLSTVGLVMPRTVAPVAPAFPTSAPASF